MYCACNQWNGMGYQGHIRELPTPPPFGPMDMGSGDWYVTGREANGTVWVGNTKNMTVWRSDPTSGGWVRVSTSSGF